MCIYLGSEHAVALVDDAKNVDGAIDMTLQTPILSTLIGGLACLHCMSVMLTFVMLLKVSRRLQSMSESNVLPA